MRDICGRAEQHNCRCVVNKQTRLLHGEVNLFSQLALTMLAVVWCVYCLFTTSWRLLWLSGAHVGTVLVLDTFTGSPVCGCVVVQRCQSVLMPSCVSLELANVTSSFSVCLVCQNVVSIISSISADMLAWGSLCKQCHNYVCEFCSLEGLLQSCQCLTSVCTPTPPYMCCGVFGWCMGLYAEEC